MVYGRILFPEKESGHLEHILVPIMRVCQISLDNCSAHSCELLVGVCWLGIQCDASVYVLNYCRIDFLQCILRGTMYKSRITYLL